MKSLYIQLLQRNWKGKPVWEHIRDNTLTSAPAFVGKQFHCENSSKIMIVGRAVNGWQVSFPNYSNIEKTADSILLQDNCLDDFARDYVIGENTGNKYYYAKSPFIRLMKTLVELSTSDVQNWQQRIIWSNLYKVAPRDEGNPPWLLTRNDINVYTEIVRQEILLNKPQKVVFVTGLEYFDPYPGNEKYGSFLELLNKESVINYPENSDICLRGRFENDQSVEIIVCKRPEYRSVGDLAREILDLNYKRLKFNSDL